MQIEPHQFEKFVQFDKILLRKTSIEEGLPHIATYAREILEAERCSVFVYNSQKEQLWTTLADGVDKIIIDANKGLVGQSLLLKKPIIENNPYENPLFFKETDKKTGYKTKNIIATPIFDSQERVLGILELLNKRTPFSQKDVEFVTFFADYISGFIMYPKLPNKDA